MPLVFSDYLESLVKEYTDGYLLCMQMEDSTKDLAPYNFTVMAPSQENAGVDLASVEDWCGVPGDNAHLLDLGVRAMLVNLATREPVHYWLLPRSSIYKTGHMMANSVGVIDSSYRGVLKAPVICSTGIGSIRATGFKRGERYFQIVAPDMGPIRIVRAVSSLPDSARGEGGFGSTGN
jgi:dUTPase